MNSGQRSAGITGQAQDQPESGPVIVGEQITVFDQIDRLTLAGHARDERGVEIVDGGKVGRRHQESAADGVLGNWTSFFAILGRGWKSCRPTTPTIAGASAAGICGSLILAMWAAPLACM